MKTKILSVFLAIMTIAFITTAYFLYQNKTTTVSVDAALKQLDYKIKQPTYIPFQVTKTEAKITQVGIYQEILITYSNPDLKQMAILRVTDEKLEPSYFSDKIKLSNGTEAIHLSPFGQYSPDFQHQPHGKWIFNLYWTDGYLFYSLFSSIDGAIGVGPVTETVKMANSMK